MFLKVMFYICKVLLIHEKNLTVNCVKQKLRAKLYTSVYLFVDES